MRAHDRSAPAALPRPDLRHQRRRHRCRAGAVRRRRRTRALRTRARPHLSLGRRAARAPDRARARAATARRSTNSARSTCASPQPSPMPRWRCSTQPASTPAQVRAIGSHGQTVRHRPAGARDAAVHAAARRRQRHRRAHRHRHGRRFPPPRRRRRRPRRAAAAGIARRAAALRRTKRRAVLNLGGIANLTLLPARHGAGARLRHRPGQCAAGCLVRAPHRRGLRRRRRVRRQRRASMPRCWRRCCAEPWFALPPPKSTGREQFHLDWLRGAAGAATSAPQDVQATLLELTAASVADALRADAAGHARDCWCAAAACTTRVLLRAHRRAAAGRARSNPPPCTASIRISSRRWALPGWRGRRSPDARATCRPSPARAAPRVLGAIVPGLSAALSGAAVLADRRGRSSGRCAAAAGPARGSPASARPISAKPGSLGTCSSAAIAASSALRLVIVQANTAPPPSQASSPCSSKRSSVSGMCPAAGLADPPDAIGEDRHRCRAGRCPSCSASPCAPTIVATRSGARQRTGGACRSGPGPASWHVASAARNRGHRYRNNAVAGKTASVAMMK